MTGQLAMLEVGTTYRTLGGGENVAVCTVEAIDQRDAQRAQALITEHLGKARDDLMRANSR